MTKPAAPFRPRRAAGSTMFQRLSPRQICCLRTASHCFNYSGFRGLSQHITHSGVYFNLGANPPAGSDGTGKRSSRAPVRARWSKEWRLQPAGGSPCPRIERHPTLRDSAAIWDKCSAVFSQVRGFWSAAKGCRGRSKYTGQSGASDTRKRAENTWLIGAGGGGQEGLRQGLEVGSELGPIACRG